MNYIWIAVAAIFGILIGVIFTAFIKRKQVSHGALIIDLTSPDRDIYRIVLDEDLESLAKKTRVQLKVEVKTISQE